MLISSGKLEIQMEPVPFTLTAVQSAYRRAALTCHPDKVGADDLTAKARFLAAGETYWRLVIQRNHLGQRASR